MTAAAASRLNRAYGLARSLWLYYGKPAERAAMRGLYARYIRPGDLCFDIGAHVGSRSRLWSAMGARVVAVEPQPDLARFLRLLFRRDPRVTLLEEAIGAESGTLRLHVSPRTPTVTSGSRDFIDEARRTEGFAWVDWSHGIDVPVTTLDRLIAVHGRPAFVKIDVEGMEHEVLAGLGEALPALSFEFVPASPRSALASLDRLAALGDYRCNVALGETARLLFDRPLTVPEIRAWLESRPADGPSGDIYATLA